MHLILKIGISRDTECVNTVGFPKLGHIWISSTNTNTVNDKRKVLHFSQIFNETQKFS